MEAKPSQRGQNFIIHMGIYSLQSVVSKLANLYHICTTFLFQFQKLVQFNNILSLFQTSSLLWATNTCLYQWYYDVRSGRRYESSSTTICLTAGYINTHFSSNDGNLYIYIVIVTIFMIDVLYPVHVESDCGLVEFQL